MQEPLYPPLTENQLKILLATKTSQSISRRQIYALLGVDQQQADAEISSLIIRGALVADAADRDLFSPG